MNIRPYYFFIPGIELTFIQKKICAKLVFPPKNRMWKKIKHNIRFRMSKYTLNNNKKVNIDCSINNIIERMKFCFFPVFLAFSLPEAKNAYILYAATVQQFVFVLFCFMHVFVLNSKRCLFQSPINPFD